MGNVFKFPGTPDTAVPDEPTVAQLLHKLADSLPDDVDNAIVLILDANGNLISDSVKFMNMGEYIGAIEIAKATAIYQAMYEDEE